MNLHKKSIFTGSNLSNIYEKYDTNKTIKELFEAKHYLPSNKEWINSIYNFNSKSLIYLPVKDKILYKLLKSFFNLRKNKLKNFTSKDVLYSSYKRKKSNSKAILSLINKVNKNSDLRKNITLLRNWHDLQKNDRFTSLEKVSRNRNVFYQIAKRRLLKLKKINNNKILKRTYLSLPDIKHYNNKSTITVSIYNKDRIFFKKKVYKYYKLFVLKKRRQKADITLNYFKLLSLEKKILNKSKFFNKKLYYSIFIKLNYLFFNKQKINNVNFKHILKNTSLKDISKVNHLLKNKLRKIKIRLRIKYKKILKYKYYMLNLCFIKFRLNNSNLIGLKNIIKKIYNKKIILKIINLKYMYLDSNIITEIITKRLKNRKNRILRLLKKILKRIKRVSIVKGIWLESLKINVNISSSNDENNLLNINKLYNLSPVNMVLYKEFLMRSKKDLRSLILYNTSNKTISGIKIQGSGRLTKRLTASRSITKFRSKGSLKNINSSFHNISTIMLRGYLKSNLQYMNINSYNRNGSFGMKTWISSY